MNGIAEINGAVKTMPSHARLYQNSNRKSWKPESVQLIENKPSGIVLIATFRGCFRTLQPTCKTSFQACGGAVIARSWTVANFSRGTVELLAFGGEFD